MTSNVTTVVETLDSRIRRLEHIHEIQQLMTRYGAFVDNSYDLAGLETLLTEDLEWTSNVFGSYHGRAAYLAGQAEIAKGVAWAFHIMTTVDVDVQSDHNASGRFYLLMLGTFVDEVGANPEPIVLTARYDNDFRNVEDHWRCSRMEVYFHQVSRLPIGWVREPYWSR